MLATFNKECWVEQANNPNLILRSPMSFYYFNIKNTKLRKYWIDAQNFINIERNICLLELPFWYANIYPNIPSSSVSSTPVLILKTKRGWSAQPHHVTIIGLVIMNVTPPPRFPHSCKPLPQSVLLCQIGKSKARILWKRAEILIPLFPS
jgi:hypothetical protein